MSYSTPLSYSIIEPPVRAVVPVVPPAVIKKKHKNIKAKKHKKDREIPETQFIRPYRRLPQPRYVEIPRYTELPRQQPDSYSPSYKPIDAQDRLIYLLERSSTREFIIIALLIIIILFLGFLLMKSHNYR